MRKRAKAAAAPAPEADGRAAAGETFTDYLGRLEAELETAEEEYGKARDRAKELRAAVAGKLAELRRAARSGNRPLFEPSEAR
jgi:hypothetical protein